MGRYIRIDFTSNWGSALVCMVTLHLCDSSGVKWNDEGMTHTFGGGSLNGDPSYCSDTNTGTYWQTWASAIPNWWKVDLGTISKVKTQCLAGSADRNFKDFTVSESDDDSTYTEIYAGATANDDTEQTFDCVPPAPVVEGDTAEDFSLDDTVSWEYIAAPAGTISDDFTLDDSFAQETMNVETPEAFSLSDDMDGDYPKRTISESIVIADNLTAPGSTYSTSLSEGITLSDSMVGSEDLFESISEALSLSDDMVPLLLSDSISEGISFSDSMEADDIIWIRPTFPNLSGKHLTLKFIPINSALYFMRMKMFRTVDRVDHDARHPNLGGQHLALKIQHTAEEEFTLAYASMGLLGKVE
jgi:hypothetical protein